jgi:agmatine deiminase
MAARVASRVPAESLPHLRTLMAWPALPTVWDSTLLYKCQSEVAAIANVISRFEPVTLFARPEAVAGARARVSHKVSITPMEVEELWIRDSGSMFTVLPDGKPAGIDLRFNDRGTKYP